MKKFYDELSGYPLLRKLDFREKGIVQRCCVFLVAMFFSVALSAHSWEVRVNQELDGTLTWYVQSYHTVSGCGPTATTLAGSGVQIDGVNYNFTAEFPGSVVPLSPTVFSVSPSELGFHNSTPGCVGVTTPCGSRQAYAVVNTPYSGGTISVLVYGNNACYVPYFDLPVANGAFVPPPPPCNTPIVCPDDVVEELIDECTTDITYDTGDFCDCDNWRGIRSDGGPDLTEANGYTGSFPVCTDATIDWECTDAAGAVSIFCTSSVSVTEALDPANEPNAICEGNITLGLGDDGTVELCAETYGGLSNDDCGDVDLKIHVLGTPLEDCITFDCDDIGDHDVCLVVTDCSGNEALCFGTITIQDKRDPYIVCPADITIECHVDNGGNPDPGPDLDGILVPFSQTAFDAALALSAAGGPTPGQDATNGITGFAQGWDNCGATISYTDVSTQDPDPTMCGHYSYTITRTWVITDAFGNDVSPFGGDGNDCDQIITVQDTGFPWFTEDCDALDVVLDCDDPNYELDKNYALGLAPTPNDLCYVTMTLTEDVETADFDGFCQSFTDCAGNVINNVTGLRQRTWTAVDACGNATEYEQNLYTIDITAPNIDCPYEGAAQDFYLDEDGCWEEFGTTAFLGGGTDGVLYNRMQSSSGFNTLSALAGFLGIAPGDLNSLNSGQATNGSAIKQEITVAPGDQITFDWRWNTNDYSPYDDFAFVMLVEDGVVVLASVLTNGSFSSTPWATYTHNAVAGGTCYIAFGVMNSIDNGVTSYLSVDNVRVDGNLIGEGSFESGTFDPAACGDDCEVWIPLIAGADDCQSGITWTHQIKDADGNPIGSIQPGNDASDFFTTGSYCLQFWAEDDCGNESTCLSFFNVLDTISPVFDTCPGSEVFTLSTDPDECTATLCRVAPTASDNCDIDRIDYTMTGATEGTFTVGDNACGAGNEEFEFNVGETTVTYTAYDLSGNTTSDCSFTVTVIDDQLPLSANCPTDYTLNTSLDGNNNYGCFAPDNWKSPIIDENCKLDSYTCTLTLPDGTVIGPDPTESDFSQSFDFPVGVTNVKYLAVDESGNIYCCTYNVTVLDDENPAMICQDITVELGADGTYTMLPSEIDNGSNDNCPGLTLDASQTIFNCNHLGDNLITLTGTDAAGNTAECWATVTVEDNIDPVLTCADHARTTSEVLAGDCGHTAAGGEFDAIASDNTDPLCPLTLTNDYNGTSSLDGETFIACDSPYTIVWTATDVAGNSVSCTSIITITDDELPQPITRSGLPGDPYADGLVDCGDLIEKDATLGDCTYDFSWIDFTLLDFEDNCDIDGCGLASIEGPLATVECVEEPGGMRSADFPVGCTDVSYNVTDVAGNTYVCTFTVCVTDTQAPLINCPDDQPFNVDLNCANPVLDDFQGQTDYSDNCPGVTLSQSPASGTSLLGMSAGDVITITMTATDAAGLSTSCDFDVTLVDDEGVTINCNVPFNVDNVPVDENCQAALADYAASASYQSSCNPSLVLSPYQDPAPGTLISVSTVVTVSVDDGNGNISSCSFTVNPVDETAPECPTLPDVLVSATAGCTATASWTAADATDNCDGLVVGVQTGGPANGSTFSAGSTLITYTYTDANNNSTDCSFNVIVDHGQAPYVVCDPITGVLNSNGEVIVDAEDFDEGSNSACGSPLEFLYTTDVDAFGTAEPDAEFFSSILWTCDDLIPGQPSTSYEVILRVTDSVSGEYVDCFSLLTLSDDLAPQITQCPADVTINTSNDGGDDCFGTATLQLFEATDNCGVAYSYDIEYADGSMASEDGQDASGSFPTGVSTITFTVEDPSGNRRSTCQTTVTVIDDESPLCESPDQTPNPPVPGSLTTLFAANNGGASGWTMFFDITVGPEDITIQSFDNNFSTTAAFTGNVYTKLGTSVGFQNNAGAWGAPASGGSGVGAGTNNPSNMLLFSPITLLANTTYGIAINATGAPQYTNGNSANQTASNGDLTINLGQSQAGLFTGALFNPRVWNGTVNYTIGGGTISSNEDIEVDAAPGACGQIVEYEIPQGFDNCGIETVELIEGLPSGSVFPIGTTFVNYLLTDAAGLSVECGFNVTVFDVNPPVLTCPEDIITAADADACTAQLVVEPDVLDECAEAMIEVCFEFLDSPESTSWTLLNEFGLVVQAAAAGTYSGNECVTLDVNPGNYELVVEGFFGTYTVESNGMVSTYNTDLSSGDYSAEVALLTDIDLVWTATGAFQTEMGYEVFDSNGDFVAFDGYGLGPVTAAQTPFIEDTFSLIGGQTYTFRALESFGDGWHGNTFQLQNDGTPLTLTQTVGTGGNATNITVVPTDPSYIPIASGNMVPGPGTNQEYAEYDFTVPSSSGTGELCITSDVLGSGLSFAFTNTTTNTVLVSGAAGSFGNNDTQCFPVSFVSGDSYELVINGFYGADAFFTVEDPLGVIIQTAGGADPQTNSMFAATGGTTNVECSYVVTNADGDVIGAGNGLSGSPAPAGYNLELVTTSIFSSEQAWVLSGPGGIVDSSPFGDLVGVSPGTIATFELDYGTTYTFEAIDSFGDGWDNGTMELQTAAGDPVILTDITAGGTTTIITANAADPDYVGGAPIGNGPGSDDEVHTYQFTTPALTSGFAYPLGENTITWTCVDDADNSATCSTTVTVNDEQDPNIACPEDITTLTDAGDCFAALSLEAPEVSDNADPCIPAEPDCASNRDVNIIYFDDGSFDGEHAYVIYEGGGLTTGVGATVVAQQGYGIFGAEGSTIETVSLTPGVTYTFAAIDDFGDGWDGFDVQLQLADDNSVILVDNLNTGGLGQTTIGNLSSSDISGNEYSGPLGGAGSRTDTYTLYEFEIPCTPAAGTHAVTTSLITFPDGTTQAGSGTVSEDFPPGTSTVEYTATDAAGNTSSCTTTINVADEEDPICNAPFAAATYNVDPGACEACITFADFTSADNCMVAFSGHNSIYADSPGENASGCYPVGSHTVKYFSNDMFGNACVTEINFEVIDNEAPTASTPPADITTCNDAGLCLAQNVDLGSPVFDDNCGLASVSNDDDGLFILGDNLVTWTVTDIHGNISTFEQTVTIEDCDAPTIDCPADINVSNTIGGDCSVTVTGLDLDISDNCEIPNLSLEICTDDNSELTEYIVSSGAAPNLTYQMTTNTSGSFDGEVGWQLFNSNGDVVFEWEGNLNPLPGPGTVVQTWNLEQNETYTLEAVDSFGDGWNGNSFIIDDLGNPVVLNDITNGGTTTTVIVNNNDPSYSGDLFPGGFGPEVHTYQFTTPISNYVEYASGVAGDLAGNDGGCTTIPLPSIAGDFDLTFTNLFGTYEVVTETGTVLASGTGGTSAPQINAPISGSLQYSMVVGTSGAFDNEVGWQLIDSGGNVIAEWEGDQNPLPTGAGTVIQTWDLAYGETYTLDAVDSFGDGWNGNTFMVDDDANAIVLDDITSGGTTTTVIVNATDPPYNGPLFPNGFGPEHHVYEFTTPPQPTTTFTLDLTPNVESDQLSWEVEDESNNIVASAAAGTYAGTDGSTSTETFTLTGSHSLAIDGLFAGGSYELTDDAGGIVASGTAPDEVLTDTYSLVGASFTVAYDIDFGPGDSSATGNVVPFDQDFPVGTSTITWTATDENGNTSDECVTTVTVTDVNPPVLVAPNSCDNGSNANGGVVDFGTSLELPLEIGADLEITDITSIEITGMFNNDFSSLDMFLQSPAGTVVQVIDGDDYPSCGFIFNGFTIQEGGAGASACPGTDGNEVNPTEALSAFNGESSQGTWTLIVSTDAPGNDGGVVFGWNLEVCGDESACAENLTVDADANCQATVTLPIPNAEDCDELDYFYSLDGGVTRVLVAGDDVDLTFGLGMHIVTWIVRDEAGNEVSCGTTVTVEDNTAPALACPPDVTGESGQFNCESPMTLALATATDNCSATTITNDSPYADAGGADASGTYPVGTTTVTFTATDDAGNVSTCTTDVTVLDLQDPIVSCGSTLNLNLPIGGSLEVPADLFAAASYDNCGDPTITIEGGSTIVFDCTEVGLNAGLTVTATDASGNTASCWIDVLIKDEIAISCNDDAAITGGTADCVTGLFELTAGNITPPTFVDNVIFGLCPWTIETTVDGVAGDPVGFYPAGTYEVCWTATGSDGTTATCCASFTVAPAGSYTCPGDVTLDADANCEAYATLAVADNCTEPLSVTNDSPYADAGGADASGTYPLGSTLVTFSIIDAWGNPATCTATVTVEDNTAPTIACPAAVNFGSAPLGECSADVTLALATAADNCSVTITNDYNGNGADASDNYPVGTTTVTFTATDGAGNTATCTTDVTVTDVEDPVASCPGDVTINASDDGYDCGAYAGAAGEMTATATDNCGVATIFHDSPYADTNLGDGDARGVYPVGTTTVTFTITDVNGNAVTCTTDVTVIDDLGPALSCPADITVSNDAGVCGADLSPIATSSENCDVSYIEYTINYEDGSSLSGNNQGGLGSQHLVAASAFYPVGTHTVTYTAYDLVGNSATCTTTVTVNDDEAPVCAAQDLTVALDGDGNATITAADVNNGSTDNCGIASLSVSPSAFDCSNTGANTVTLTVTDVNGNVSTCDATVTVEDNEAPDCAAQDLTVELDAAGQASITPAQVDNGSSDNCGVALSLDDDSFDCTDLGPNTVNLTVTDPSGNSSTCSATITVEDNIAPVLTCPADVDSSNAKGECGNYVIAIANASDNCSVIITNDSPYADAGGGDASGYYPVGSHVVTFVATDPSGNTDTCTTTITVIDDEAPNVLCIELITATLISNGTVIVPACAIDNGSFDNCTSNGDGDCLSSDLTYLINGQPSIVMDCSNLGLNAVTLTVIDEAGNSASCETFVDVQDNDAPVISALPQATYSAAFDPAASCGAFLTIPVPATDDLCPGVTLVNDYNGTADASDEYPIGTTTVTWTATDAAGNASTYSINVVVGNIPAASNLGADCNGSQFMCTWNPVPGTAGYKVFLRQVGGPIVGSALFMNPAQSSTGWVNNSVVPAGEYEFAVVTGCLLDPTANPNDLSAYATAWSVWMPITLPCTPPMANNDNEIEQTTDDSAEEKVWTNDDASMIVYPNPNIGQFTIETDLEFYTLEVLDMTGKVIFREESLTDNVYRAELSTVESGVYFVRLIGDTDVLTKRVIIER